MPSRKAFALLGWSSLAFLLVALLLAITMFALIALADLEHDLANPHDTTSKLNALSKPEVALQGALTLVSLVTQGWVSLACSLPVAVYHGRRYLRSDLEFDVTEIFSTLSREKRDRLIKVRLFDPTSTRTTRRRLCGLTPCAFPLSPRYSLRSSCCTWLSSSWSCFDSRKLRSPLWQASTAQRLRNAWSRSRQAP